MNTHPERRWCMYCTDSQGRPKHTFTSEQDAKDALLEAKIKAGLRGNRRRREQRTYECPVRPGWHHLTAVDEAEVEIRKAEQARRKQLRPYVQALTPALAGTDLDAQVETLAAVLHDTGWTPPRRGFQQRAA